MNKELTEQFKKGELPEGHYYGKDGENMIAEYLDGYFYNNGEPMTSFSGGVDEVLAPVPSYDEWEKLNWYAGNGVEKNQELKMENERLKQQLHRFAESNQSLRKRLDEEKAKNRIDYYDGSPMDFLDECERDRKKNKIYKNLINNIRDELIISDLRRIDEGNKFIAGILSKIDEVLK